MKSLSNATRKIGTEKDRLSKKLKTVHKTKKINPVRLCERDAGRSYREKNKGCALAGMMQKAR